MPTEVSIPLVPSRVEQLGDLPREGIDPGDVRSLVAVVVEAGESQVAERRRTAVLTGHDVVNRERDCGIIHLWHAAVFADVTSAPSHFFGFPLIHQSSRDSSRLQRDPRLGMEQREQMPSFDVALKLFLLV